MRTSLAFATLMLVACGAEFSYSPPPNEKESPPTPQPQPQPEPPMDMGGSDATCGGQQFSVERVPPNVMLVLDRSGSMGGAISSGSATTKWNDLKAALQTLVTNYDSKIRLGAAIYSSDGNCATNELHALAPSNGTNILAKVNANGPAGNTPTAGTLAKVIAQGALNDPTRENVVVLATDGIPNCGDVDVNGKITQLYNAAPSVKTYVIGLGDGTASNPMLLNAWAESGHTARPGATKYYQTNSPAELKAAFDTIAGGIASCTFKLGQSAPDPSKLYVDQNGAVLAQDPVNGYTYDAAGPSVTLHGAACDKLKNDPMSKIGVLYGCPEPPPPPPIF
jgi:hypothetical protein